MVDGWPRASHSTSHPLTPAHSLGRLLENGHPALPPPPPSALPLLFAWCMCSTPTPPAEGGTRSPAFSPHSMHSHGSPLGHELLAIIIYCANHTTCSWWRLPRKLVWCFVLHLRENKNKRPTMLAIHPFPPFSQLFPLITGTPLCQLKLTNSPTNFYWLPELTNNLPAGSPLVWLNLRGLTLGRRTKILA